MRHRDRALVQPRDTSEALQVSPIRRRSVLGALAFDHVGHSDPARSADDVEDVGTRVDIVRDKKSDLDKQREGLAEFVAKLRQDANARPAQRLDRLDFISDRLLMREVELVQPLGKRWQLQTLSPVDPGIGITAEQNYDLRFQPNAPALGRTSFRISVPFELPHERSAEALLRLPGRTIRLDKYRRRGKSVDAVAKAFVRAL